MERSTKRSSLISENEEQVHRSSITVQLPSLASAPSIQKLSLKHLPTIDAKRFMRVLDNTVTRVLLVSSFRRIVQNIKEYSLLLGRNATVLFQEYGPLSEAYDEQCNRAKSRPRYTDRDAFGKQNRQSILTFNDGFNLTSETQNCPFKKEVSLATQLFDLTRAIFRELLENPIAISALIKHREQWDIEPSISCRRLAIQLVHLRSLTRNDLLTTPKARAKRDDFLERLRRRDMDQSRTIDEVKKQFDDLQEAQKVQVFDRMERIRRIQDKMRKIQEQTQTSLADLKQKYDCEKRIAKRKFREALTELTSAHQAAKEQLERLTQENLEREQRIRMEKWKIEDNVVALLTKTDTELFEMQAEYDQLEEADSIEREACEELLQKLEPLKAKADAVLEEKRLDAERQAAEIAEQENMIRAATTIQSLWRSWKTRKTIKAERRKNRGNRGARR